MSRDDIEMVEVGPTDIDVLVEALRKLNNGIDALKITVGYLNERVAGLQKTIDGLEEALKEHIGSMQEERRQLESEIEALIGRLDEQNTKFARDIKLSMDLFLDNMSRRLEKLQERLGELDSDVASLRAQMKELELVATDAANVVKAETGSVRSKVSELEALVAELSTRLDKLESDIIASNRENEARFGEILTRLASIEKLVRGEAQQV